MADEFPPVKKALEEDVNEVPLSRLSLSNESEGEADGECGDYFPFNALPDELIGHTFSFLSIKDRLRARVNKRLNEIELKSKYYVNKMIIGEPTRPGRCATLVPVNHFITGRTYSSDCFRRLAHNLSIGILHFSLTYSSEFNHEMCSIIKEFDISTLDFPIPDDLSGSELIVDSLFIDLARSCKILVLWNPMWLRPLRMFDNEIAIEEAFHQVYKTMMDDSTKLREIKIFQCTRNQYIRFLKFIGITYRNGRFFSSGNIEAIEEDAGDGIDICFFNGNLEIQVPRGIFMDDTPFYHIYDFFLFKVHENEDSLRNAKKREGFVRVEITRE